MSGCRIGKIKLKTGGHVRLLPVQKRGQCHKSIEHLSNCINENTFAVAFIVMDKERVIRAAGCSYEQGFAYSDLIGMCESMKEDLKQKIWPVE
jgi:hypothetical protein